MLYIKPSTTPRLLRGSAGGLGSRHVALPLRRTQRPMLEGQAAAYAEQILSAASYCHQRGALPVGGRLVG